MSAYAAPGSAGRRRNLTGLLVLALSMGMLPLLVHTPYALSTLVLVGIYAIVTIGLCLLMGYAGQVSLGQAAFYGLGAYGSAILTTKLHWSPWLGIVAAAAATGFIAYLVGMPILRLRGHYLAMGTLALGVIVFIVLNEWKPVTGGPTGLPGVPRLAIGSLVLKEDLAYYYLVWICVLLALASALNIVNSRFGRALRAIRDSDLAAESLGVDLARFKLQVLVTSAIYASVAGSLYAHYMTFVSPTAFDFNTSVRLLLMATVGGLSSIWGAPFGAAGVVLLSLALRELLPLLTGGGSGEQQTVAYGVLLVVIMIFMPEGLVAAGLRAWRLGGSGALPRLRAWVATHSHTTGGRRGS
jgi:branched-chain amino acid transport system permease protein